jgi:Domain of unknown function (DUF4349)
MSKLKFLIFAVLAFSTACASGSISNTNSFSKADTASSDSGSGGGGGRLQEPSAVQQVSLNQAENSQPQTVAIERKIVRNADLELEANSSEESQQKITAIAESKGGFVVESQQSSSDVRATTRDIVTMTVRVPSAKFNETLDEIRKTANRVIVETIKSDDVTEEFIDIEARLKAKKSLEEQFLEIMKRANSVEDALNVQTQLAEVRGEIEKIEGRKRFLENQASLSTIKIRLQTPSAFSANSSGFFYRLKESFSSGFNFALNFVLVLITFLIGILPFLLFIVLPVYLLIRYFWRKQHRQKSIVEIAKEEL